MRVSIPYRLATNAKKIVAIIGTAQVFQFLIGWLQTEYKEHETKSDDSEVSIPYRLATNWTLGFNFISATNEFQFLIGWLQTGRLDLILFLLLMSFNSL